MEATKTTEAGSSTFDLEKNCRYRLTRNLTLAPSFLHQNVDNGTIGWLMLNPSHAMHDVDDMTIGKIKRWTMAWGFSKLIVVNLFPYRSPDPKVMLAALRRLDLDAKDRNLLHVREVARTIDFAMAAFGRLEPSSEYIYSARGTFDVFTERHPTFCLRTSAGGWPVHPMARGRNALPAMFPFDALLPWTWPAPSIPPGK